MQICSPTPIPTLDGLLASMKPALTFPPAIPAIPALSTMLPAFPYPLLGSLGIPNLELTMAAIELQAFQLCTTVLAIIKPIIAKLGIPLLSFLPKIPGLPGCTIMDLLEGKGDKLIAAVKKALAAGFTIPMLPFPIYPTLKMPDLEAAHALQAIVANYMFILITKVAGIVQQVVGKFKGMPHPTLPVFPTPDGIMKSLYALAPQPPTIPGVPGLPTQAGLLNKIKGDLDMSISAAFGKISFPGMPAFPALPHPLVPSFRFPDIELAVMILAFNINLQLGLLKPIMDFIASTLGAKLTFTFPKMCLTIPSISVPAIAVPSIPHIG